MHVLVAHPHAWPEVRRGGERYADDLTRYLRSHGHRVTSVAGRSGPPPAREPDDVRLRHLPTVHRGRVRLRPEDTYGARIFPTLLRMRGRCDLVHAMVPSAAIAARLAGHRVVFTLLGSATDESMRGRPHLTRLLARAIEVSDRVTVLSTPVAEQVVRRFGIRPVVLAPGVSSARFAVGARSERPTVLFASAMVPEKGLDVLLAALPRLRVRHPDARLVLAGPGDTPAGLDPAAVEVRGVGAEGDLPRLMASSHTTVLPSRNEAFGLVLVESLMSGTPIVGTVTGGAADIVTSEVGRCSPFGDVEALADAVGDALDLAGDPDTARRCRARALQWGWDEGIGPAHVDLYDDVVARPGGKPGSARLA